MTKNEWQLFHGFADEDMFQIELTLLYGHKITGIFDVVLGYKIIKISS